MDHHRNAGVPDNTGVSENIHQKMSERAGKNQDKRAKCLKLKKRKIEIIKLYNVEFQKFKIYEKVSYLKLNQKQKIR